MELERAQQFAAESRELGQRIYDRQPTSEAPEGLGLGQRFTALGERLRELDTQ